MAATGTTLNTPNELSKAAPLWRVLLSVLYDTLIVVCIIFIAWQPVPLLDHFNMPVLLSLLIRYLYLFAITFGFFGWFWVHGGQTIGMRAWKIKLISAAPDSNIEVTVSWMQALRRYAMAIVSCSMFGFGFLWILFNAQRRSWHDLISASRLIKLKPLR